MPLNGVGIGILKPPLNSMVEEGSHAIWYNVLDRRSMHMLYANELGTYNTSTLTNSLFEVTKILEVKKNDTANIYSRKIEYYNGDKKTISTHMFFFLFYIGIYEQIFGSTLGINMCISPRRSKYGDDKILGHNSTPDQSNSCYLMV
ncbi:hypothetical protein ACJX0J_006107, partial [Zea mays]